MTTQHTPGPWSLGDTQSARFPPSVYADRTDELGRGYWTEVAQVKSNTEPERQANARLIAAAPTMLATLQAVLESMGDYYDATDAAGDEGGSLHDLVESTIRQATQS